MYRIISLVALCVLALQVDAATFKDCGSEVGHYTSVTVSGCTASEQKCILKRNTNATIQITFNVNNDTPGVTAVVHGILMVPIPFPISKPDACNDDESGLKCPLAKDGGPYTYKATLFVEKSYPKLSLDVKWELKDENKKDIVCVTIPAKIQ